MTTTMLDFNRVKSLMTKKIVGDPNLWKQILLIVVGLTVFGAIEVFSASRYMGVELTNNAFYFGIQHVVYIGISALVACIVALTPSTLWKKLTWVGYLLVMAMLAAVFFFPGQNGAHRWIPIGSISTFQPSEAAKLVAVLLGAFTFTTLNWDKNKKYIDHLKSFALSTIPLALMLVLILIQPDLGNVVVIGVSYFTMYLLTSSRWKRTDILVLLGVGITIFLLALIPPSYRYRMERIITQLEFVKTGQVQDEFGTGYQLRNILIAVGSGGVWGKGVGQSTLKQGYLVEVTAFTDSIGAVIFEELGFLLSMVFVGVYLYFFLLLTQIAERQTNQYERLVMWGLAMWFITQSLFHFAANVALIPVKGITLPFVSYGGSSLLSFGVFTGMVIRLARRPS